MPICLLPSEEFSRDATPRRLPVRFLTVDENADPICNFTFMPQASILRDSFPSTRFGRWRPFVTQFSLIMIFVIVVLLAAGAGGIAAIFHFRVKRSKKEIETIEGTPSTGAGRLQSGLHKASGTSVGLDKPVVSPLTECVFYHFRIEELRTSQRDTRKI